jgi:hypothetical protein
LFIPDLWNSLIALAAVMTGYKLIKPSILKHLRRLGSGCSVYDNAITLTDLLVGIIIRTLIAIPVKVFKSA